MPAIPISKSHSTPQTLPVGTSNRSSFFYLHGYRNRPEWPTSTPESTLQMGYQRAFGCYAQRTWWWGTVNYVSSDAPNMQSYYYAHASWDERLYSGAYSKFTERARQGSAEWGMNIVQGRKALSTFIQLALTAATSVTALRRTYGKAFEWLRSNPNETPATVRRRRRKLGRTIVRAREKADRVRLSNEAWLLDQVTSLLLAYRYGVAPLMSDLATTADILSKDFDQKVILRVSKKKPWGGGSTASDELWTGTESVVLRATVSVSNPNLLLANRLGIINPQMWAWDATPWSFVVDWWFPVGSFLQNFTALVGLNVTDSSVTRSRAWMGQWIPKDPEATFVLLGDGRFTGKRKERVPGSFPIPTTVAYGTGLGIQRGQNALALIVQKLK